MDRKLTGSVLLFSVASLFQSTIMAAEPGSTPAALSPSLQRLLIENPQAVKRVLGGGSVQGIDEKVVQEIKGNPAVVETGLSVEEFKNKYFGVGLYANFDMGANKRVNKASVVNGIVRIDEANSSQLGFILEAHRFIEVNGSGTRASGPIVGIVASGDGGISSGTIGYMVAFRPNSSFVSNQSSINVGFGVTVSPNTQVLGDGLAENQPLPAGETDIRYKKMTLFGFTITVSFGF